MKTTRLLLITVLVLVVMLGLFGCGSSGGGGSSVKVYGGADPKGDYITLEIDMQAKTLKYHNYSSIPNQHLGPYTFTKITDPTRNAGFDILYQTQGIPEYSKPNCYAIFAIMDGVCVIYQMVEDTGTLGDYTDDTKDGYPNFAFYRKMVGMDNYRGTAYNWVSFKMGATEGLFETGFGAFDTNTTAPAGRLYGAGYNQQRELEGAPNNGVKEINDNNIGTSSFTYNSSIGAYTAGSLTMIGTVTGDFILDHGLNNGAGFAIRQAASKDWQPVYNGTYFTLVYRNDDTGAVQEVEAVKIVLSGAGSVQVYDPIDTAAPSSPITLKDLETFPGGPGGTPIAPQLRDISGCQGAGVISSVVREAYKCYGGFVAGENEGLPADSVVFAMMDPGGRYFCFTMFKKTGPAPTYDYQFGFGIKD